MKLVANDVGRYMRMSGLNPRICVPLSLAMIVGLVVLTIAVRL